MSIVRRRHVFFLSGFDPKGASWYHALYARQAALQGELTGVRYEVGPRRRCASGNAEWTVHCAGAAARVETTYEYVRWDDLVRAHWPRRPLELAGAALASYWTMLRANGLRRARAAAPRTLVPLLLPAFYWVAALVIAVASAALAAALAAGGPLVQAGAAVLAASTIVAAGFAWEARLHTSWLVRIYRFAHLQSLGRVHGLEERLDALAARLDASLREPQVDEVLVVGFSVGSILAVSAVARAAQRGAPAAGRLALLTLGHCIPMLALLPGAAAFRSELQRVARAEDLTWIDFSSPTDWGSFALVDPVNLCLGTASASTGRRRFASPRFHRLFSAHAYRTMRRDKRRMHLQYLMAGECAGDYDYFDLTAGASSLRSRWEQGAAA